MLTQQKTILMMAGGTGGHIFPALAIADELKARNYRVVWLGTKNSMETKIVPKHNYPIEVINFKGVRGKGLLSLILIPFKLSIALMQTLLIFNRIKPDLCIGMGGFVTSPGGLSSWILRVPVVIHEQNAVSGMSNNLLSKFAKQCLCAFPNAFRSNQKCKVIGNPVRKEIIRLNEVEKLNHDEELRVLIVGGSLGAEKINQIIPELFKLIKKDESKNLEYKKYKVHHQCGKGKLSKVIESIGSEFKEKGIVEIDYKPVEFIDDMAEAYRWADLVICRAGALTVSEIAIVGITSILIPYPSAVDDHQTKNAEYLTDNNAGFLLQQTDLKLSTLLLLIKKCSRETIQLMGQNAKKLAKPNATNDATNACLSWITT